MLTGITDRMREEHGYDPDEDSPIDNMIAYKDALEEMVDRIDLACAKFVTDEIRCYELTRFLTQDEGLGLVQKQPSNLDETQAG